MDGQVLTGGRGHCAKVAANRRCAPFPFIALHANLACGVTSSTRGGAIIQRFIRSLYAGLGGGGPGSYDTPYKRP